MSFFSFLTTSGPTPGEVRDSLIMVACQMLASGCQKAGAEAVSDDRIWIVTATTDFRKLSLGPHFSGIAFHGGGGIRDEENIILQPFEASYLLDPDKIGKDLMGASLTDPDEFLDIFQEKYQWSRGQIIRMAEGN